MTQGHLFPWHIECALVAASGFQCGGCGQSDRAVYLLSVTVEPTSNGNGVRINYPLKCSCGRRGHATIELPILLFGYILSLCAIIQTGRSCKKPTQISPGGADLFDRYIRKFEKAVAEYASVHTLTDAWLPPQHRQHKVDSREQPNEVDRMQFGFNQKDWQDFLRRLGLDEEDPDGQKE